LAAAARAALLTLLAVGCGGTPSPRSDDGTFAAKFLADRAYRRASLEHAVVDPTNDYSALRLSRYALAEDGAATGWDALDVWNPPVRAFTLDSGGESSSASPVWDGSIPTSHAEWLALGQRAFELWPVELDDIAGTFATDAASRARFGLWTDDRDHVSGLVHVTTADAREHAAWTCSGCHARPDATGSLEYGAPNAALDRGAMSASLPGGTPPESWSWGPGVLDVTGDGIDNPTTILDLRATSRQSHLHWEATLENDLAALTVRIETLLIENALERFRPPRELAVALSLFVASLGDAGEPGDASVAPEGARVFEANCSRCHHGDGSTAPPVPVELVGTDPRAAESRSRGRGVYRIPSLWAVADRGILFHDGSVPDLATLLDPDRRLTSAAHPFGLDLSESERESLIEFLGTIGR
jgi:mono/diheme cytochrome c family protein